MPATNFHEYVRGIEDVLDATVSASEAALVSIQIDLRSALRGFIAGVLQFGDASELHFREFVDTSLPEPRLVYASTREWIRNLFSDMITQPIVLRCRRPSISTRQQAWKSGQHRHWLRL
jgi:hypothetical protein